MGASATALSTVSARTGRARAQRGDDAEARVLRTALRLAEWWWFVTAYRTESGSKLDRLGWDVVVETRDAGRIVLQVKSSLRQARIFEARGRKLALVAPIHTIVAGPKVDDATLFGWVLGTCLKARLDALAAGLTADDPRLLRLEAA